MQEEFRRCSRCGEVRPLEEFRRDRRYAKARTGKCKRCLNAYQREWERRRPVEERRARYRRDKLRQRGWPQEKLAAVRKAQGGICANPLCEQPATDADHCHATGQGRVLLCGPCNRALGHAKEDPVRLRGLAMLVESGFNAKPKLFDA